jgi:hypothetical protein
MQQLNLFKRDTRIGKGLRLLREELRLSLEIGKYREQLQALSQWSDPEEANRLITLIQSCYEDLDRTREQRKAIYPY